MRLPELRQSVVQTTGLGASSSKPKTGIANGNLRNGYPPSTCPSSQSTEAQVERGRCSRTDYQGSIPADSSDLSQSVPPDADNDAVYSPETEEFLARFADLTEETVQKARGRAFSDSKSDRRSRADKFFSNSPNMKFGNNSRTDRTASLDRNNNYRGFADVNSNGSIEEYENLNSQWQNVVHRRKIFNETLTNGDFKQFHSVSEQIALLDNLTQAWNDVALPNGDANNSFFESHFLPNDKVMGSFSGSIERPKKRQNKRTVRFKDEEVIYSAGSVASPDPADWCEPSRGSSSTLQHNSSNFAEKEIVSYDYSATKRQSVPLARAESGEDVSTRNTSQRVLNGGASPSQSRPVTKGSHGFSMIDDDDPGIMSEAETEATGTYRRGQNRAKFGTLERGDRPQPIGLVFLQYGDETKRALLPADINSLDGVRDMFQKSFPSSLSPNYLRSSRVKINIQDPTKQDLFYELDDLSELKDRSVLRLREQQTNIPDHSSASSPPTGGVGSSPYENSHSVGPAPAPAPVPSSASQPGSRNVAAQSRGYTSTEDDMNYFSEPEIDSEYRVRKSASSSSGGYFGLGRRAYENGPSPYFPLANLNRPASTVPPGSSSRSARSASSSGYYSYRGLADGPPKPARAQAGPSGPPGLFYGPAGPPSTSSSQAGRPPVSPNRNAYRAASETDRADYHARSGSGAGSYAGGYPLTDRHSYGPDRASSVPRSGSVTPVIDEEARARVIQMEDQLASLSTVVHSALMSKGVSESVFKDIEMLRREILGPGYHAVRLRPSEIDTASDAGSISRFSEASERNGHSPPTKGLAASATALPTKFDHNHGYNGDGSSIASEASAETRHLLRGMKRRVGDLQGECRHLRRMAQIHAQSSRDILRDTFDQIRVMLTTNKQFVVSKTGKLDHLSSPERVFVSQEHEKHKSGIRNIEQDLRTVLCRWFSALEHDVEALRQSVVHGQRRLRIAEVEDFTNNLAHLGRSAAALKTQFPSLQYRLKTAMSAEMEKVVREEKFLKEEPERLDSALRRCKKLTKTMTTMKKLALVQDPVALSVEHQKPAAPAFENSLQIQVSDRKPLMGPPVPPPPEDYHSPISSPNRPFTINGEVTVESQHYKNVETTLTLTKENLQTADSKQQAGGHKVLDSLLHELQTVGAAKGDLRLQKRVGFSENSSRLKEGNSKPPVSEKSASSPGSEAPPKLTNGIHSNGPVNEEHELSAPPLPSIPPPPNDYSINRALMGGYNPSSPLMGRNERSRSGTPNSVSSEPVSNMNRKPPPPPPPRSSSRGASYLNSASATGRRSPGAFSEAELSELKHQLNRGGGNRTLVPIIQTNALTNDAEPESEQVKFVKSASSSESVNSQEGLYQPPGKPPPPPPPPRNRQELMEQRQQELMSKQRQMHQNGAPPGYNGNNATSASTVLSLGMPKP